MLSRIVSQSGLGLIGSRRLMSSFKPIKNSQFNIHSIAGAATLGAVGFGLTVYARGDFSFAEAQSKIPPVTQQCITTPVTSGPNKLAAHMLPTIPLEQVQADHGDQVWVTLHGGVYNVTSFMEAHPGGPHRIMMVAGQDLSSFWGIYKLHDRPHIRNLLEEYRIGNLSEEDSKKAQELSSFSDTYEDDPERPQRDQLRIPSERPWNSEPPLKALVNDYYTPNDLFFVRNHNPVPVLSEDEWTLEIEENTACGVKSHTFTLQQLKNEFKRHEVVSALQCAGNRQEDFVTPSTPLYVAPHWRNGALGNAKWAGVKVRDILGKCGMDVDGMALGTKEYPNIKIVNFIAEDTDETGVPYAGVIPVEKAVDPFGDAILAYEMNGEILPRDHGYPVRLLAPGHAGCRNVKWVKQIILSEKPSDLDSGSKLDRHFAPDIVWDKHKAWAAGQQELNLDQGPVIQTLPVQSVICEPAQFGQLGGKDRKTIEVRGVAWSGGGRGICRVEVSMDGGKTFTAADLSAPPADAVSPQSGCGRNWAWRQWTKTLELPEYVQDKLKDGEKQNVEIVARAVDGDFNAQPEKMSSVWNVLGICVNHWPRANVTLDPNLKDDMPAPPPPAPGSHVWPDQKKPTNHHLKSGPFPKVHQP